MFGLKQGEKLVKCARLTVENNLKLGKSNTEKIVDDELNQKTGVFVTILTFPERDLRGCVGFPLGSLPLYEAVQKAAIASAFEDGRFPKLKQNELEKIIFEVSVLTKPESIQGKEPKDYAKKIEIGKDGLILQNGPFYGILLPQVPLECKWNVEEFLDNICYKASLTPDWLYDENTRLWKFQSQIFAEKDPKGEVIEIKLSEHAP